MHLPFSIGTFPRPGLQQMSMSRRFKDPKQQRDSYIPPEGFQDSLRCTATFASLPPFLHEVQGRPTFREGPPLPLTFHNMNVVAVSPPFEMHTKIPQHKEKVHCRGTPFTQWAS
eukprot:TRINITY_DN15142_c0_g2_i1.p1 TRINITY_DN15142_c0_g2~~TRINITY_DN15142_c0_g2_i1.p1  ORF type:complete len:114 (+),score=1.85 TRINITY_DN15142_c0_g2_i1:161-502(+)